jgi:hypothetical protein
MLVTIGIMFLLHSVSEVGIDKTWPAILLVIGVVKLMQSNASYDGHVGPLPPGPDDWPPTPTPPPPTAGAPPTYQGTPQNPPGGQSIDPSSGEVKNV